MKLQTSFLKRKIPKRVIIIGSVTLVVLAAAAYSLFSIQEWNSLQTRSDDASVALKAKIDSSLGAEKPTETSAAQVSNIIDDFDEKYGENPCRIAAQFAWQTVLPAIKKIQTDCDQEFANAKGVIDILKSFLTFLNDQNKIAGTIKLAVTATKDPTDYTAAASSWTSLSNSPNLSQTANSKVISDAIVASANSIATAYTHLAEANKAEDKTAYNTALDELGKAYATLATVSSTENEKYTQLVNAFMTAYEKL